MRHGTYSIVARDPQKGDLGVAVHSHWLSVGSVCPWARPGAGAVATQSVAEPAYGPRGLDAMAAGAGAADALSGLLEADESAAVRQVGMVDTHGEVAAATGPDCIPHAGHVTGRGFACQANMMREPGVPEAMARAFAAAEGPLDARLLVALDAAEGAGGDVRGRQSAALVVVPARGDPWDKLVELRVEDHADPLEELRRLVRLARAYTIADQADDLAGAGRADEAAELYLRASELAPESDELLFWAGLGLAGRDERAGVERVRAAAQVNPGWLLLLDRLSEQFAPTGAAVRRALGR